MKILGEILLRQAGNVYPNSRLVQVAFETGWALSRP